MPIHSIVVVSGILFSYTEQYSESDVQKNWARWMLLLLLCAYWNNFAYALTILTSDLTNRRWLNALFQKHSHTYGLACTTCISYSRRARTPFPIEQTTDIGSKIDVSLISYHIHVSSRVHGTVNYVRGNVCISALVLVHISIRRKTLCERHALSLSIWNQNLRHSMQCCCRFWNSERETGRTVTKMYYQ